MSMVTGVTTVRNATGTNQNIYMRSATDFRITNDTMVLHLQFMHHPTYGMAFFEIDRSDGVDFSLYRKPCDYKYGEILTGRGAEPFNSVKIDGITYNATGLTLSNAAGIQSFLNGLGKGTFTVSWTNYPLTGYDVLRIETLQNSFHVQEIVINTVETKTFKDFCVSPLCTYLVRISTADYAGATFSGLFTDGGAYIPGAPPAITDAVAIETYLDTIGIGNFTAAIVGTNLEISVEDPLEDVLVCITAGVTGSFLFQNSCSIIQSTYDNTNVVPAANEGQVYVPGSFGPAKFRTIAQDPSQPSTEVTMPGNSILIKTPIYTGNSLFVDTDRGNDTVGMREVRSVPYATIAAATADAVAGDTIYVFPGTYAENLTGKQDVTFYLHAGVTINGAVSGGGGSNVLVVRGDGVIEDDNGTNNINGQVDIECHSVIRPSATPVVGNHLVLLTNDGDRLVCSGNIENRNGDEQGVFITADNCVVKAERILDNFVTKNVTADNQTVGIGGENNYVKAIEIRGKSATPVVQLGGFGYNNVIDADIYNDVDAVDVGANTSRQTCASCVYFKTQSAGNADRRRNHVEIRGSIYSENGRGITALVSGAGGGGQRIAIYGDIKTKENAVLVADDQPDSSIRIYGDVVCDSTTEAAIICGLNSFAAQAVQGSNLFVYGDITQMQATSAAAAVIIDGDNASYEANLSIFGALNHYGKAFDCTRMGKVTITGQLNKQNSTTDPRLEIKNGIGGGTQRFTFKDVLITGPDIYDNTNRWIIYDDDIKVKYLNAQFDDGTSLARIDRGFSDFPVVTAELADVAAPTVDMAGIEYAGEVELQLFSTRTAADISLIQNPNAYRNHPVKFFPQSGDTINFIHNGSTMLTEGTITATLTGKDRTFLMFELDPTGNVARQQYGFAY